MTYSSGWFDKHWEGVTVRAFLLAVLAHNLDDVIDKHHIKSTFEVYLAVVRLTAGKLGVGDEQVPWDARFTGVLGID